MENPQLEMINFFRFSQLIKVGKKLAYYKSLNKKGVVFHFFTTYLNDFSYDTPTKEFSFFLEGRDLPV